MDPHWECPNETDAILIDGLNVQSVPAPLAEWKPYRTGLGTSTGANISVWAWECVACTCALTHVDMAARGG